MKKFKPEEVTHVYVYGERHEGSYHWHISTEPSLPKQIFLHICKALMEHYSPQIYQIEYVEPERIRGSSGSIRITEKKQIRLQIGMTYDDQMFPHRIHIYFIRDEDEFKKILQKAFLNAKIKIGDRKEFNEYLD